MKLKTRKIKHCLLCKNKKIKTNLDKLISIMMNNDLKIESIKK